MLPDTRIIIKQIIRSGTVFSLLFGITAGSHAQIKDSVLPGVLINAHVGYYFSGADLADRFGNSIGAGGGVLFKLKNNLLFGLNGTFFFGNRVKEDTILNSLTTGDGYLIGSAGSLAAPILQQRGFDLYLQGGKLFNWIGPNPNSGILLLAGVGLMQHRIRIEYIENDLQNLVPALEKDYVKGYDRLSNGISVSQFIGYLNSSNSRLVNFYAGFDLHEGFTQNRREWNFDAAQKDNQERFDLMVGLKFGWFFGIYRQTRGNTFYY